METIQILPIGAEEGIKAITRKATHSMRELMSVIGKHRLPATIEEAIKVLAQPTYPLDEKIAEAEAYAKRTKAPQVVRDRAVADAFDSVDPTMIQELSEAVSKWVDPFTPADFELNEFGAWVLSPQVVERFTDSYRVSIEGEELELASRLRDFIVEYMELSKVFDVHSLGFFKYNFEDVPPIETFCRSVLSAREAERAEQAHKQKMREKEERRRTKLEERAKEANN